MAGHTPGPWHVYVDQFSGKIDRYPGIEAKSKTVVLWADEREPDAGVQGDTPEEALANAHLIAAAPCLLAALKALMAIQDSADDCWCAESEPATCEACVCRAAISKAEGRS